MKRILPISLLAIFFLATAGLMIKTQDNPAENSALEVTPIKNISGVLILTGDEEEESRGLSAGYLMDVQVGTSDYYKSKTSAAVGNDTYISSCITYQSGSSSSFSYTYYEVPSGGGSEISKWSGSKTGSWTGCLAPITFNVSYNSKVRVEVYGNTGVQHIHQVNKD